MYTDFMVQIFLILYISLKTRPNIQHAIIYDLLEVNQAINSFVVLVNN